MEKPPHSPPPTALKALTPQEWETLIDDFHYGGARRERWTSSSSALSLLDLSLSSLLRKDLPLNLKLHLLIFLEEESSFFFPSFSQSPTRLVETLRSLIQAPVDGVSVTYSLKEQSLVSITSIFITSGVRMDGTIDLTFIKQMEGLIELLLIVMNRPNHGVDRQTRAVACECLRELEKACPTLLSEIVGHLWGLCQSERTHSAQNYVLLLAGVIHSLVMTEAKLPSNLLNTSATLIPFNVPSYLVDGYDGDFRKEISSQGYKDLRRVMSFLLEWPQYLTPCGLMEFMSIIIPVAAVLELQVSLLRVQFSGLLYTFDPLVCHAFLGMFLQFMDSFDGQESEIGRRLVLISREAQHHLVFRLLALHWLLGLFGLISNRGDAKKKAVLEDTRLSFYPTVFDPLALKALKLDLLAYCSIQLDNSRLTSPDGMLGPDSGPGTSTLKLFEDGLVSVSGFKWLPPWSTETAVAFRSFHKFLIEYACEPHIRVSGFGSSNCCFCGPLVGMP